MKQALIITSFGTSVPQARSSIEAVERVLTEAEPSPAPPFAASWPAGGRRSPASVRPWSSSSGRGLTVW